MHRVAVYIFCSVHFQKDYSKYMYRDFKCYLMSAGVFLGGRDLMCTTKNLASWLRCLQWKSYWMHCSKGHARTQREHDLVVLGFHAGMLEQ